MKKFLSMLLAMSLLLALGIPALAAGEGPAPEEAPAEVPAPAEPLEPGIQFVDDATIGGESVGGAFYVYAPEHPHRYDMLSSFLNGTIFLYPDAPVADADAALALIRELGLDESAESFPAYIVIPAPVNGESWSEADAELYWNIRIGWPAVRSPSPRSRPRASMSATS